MAAREVTALRSSGSPSTSGHNTPTVLGTTLSHGPGSSEFAEALLGGGSSGGASGGPLIRQGSMNLPKPEESGVPATHPDMCILRIRRQHLLEVCASACPFSVTLSDAGCSWPACTSQGLFLPI